MREYITPAPLTSVTTGCSLLPDTERLQQFQALSTPTVEAAETYLAEGYAPGNDGYYKRPACPACQNCVPVRIDLEHFHDSHEERRVRRKNADLTVTHAHGMPLSCDPVIKSLFLSHARNRFPDNIKNQRTGHPFKYRDFIDSYKSLGGLSAHHAVAIAPDNKIAGVVIYHKAQTAAYATLFFYDMALRDRAIGRYLVLQSIDVLKRMGITHYYLGSWNPETSAYRWKDAYKGVEFYRDGVWSREKPALKITG